MLGRNSRIHAIRNFSSLCSLLEPHPECNAAVFRVCDHGKLELGRLPRDSESEAGIGTVTEAGINRTFYGEWGPGPGAEGPGLSRAWGPGRGR